MFDDMYLVALALLKGGCRMYLCVLAYYPQGVADGPQPLPRLEQPVDPPPTPHGNFGSHPGSRSTINLPTSSYATRLGGLLYAGRGTAPSARTLPEVTCHQPTPSWPVHSVPPPSSVPSPTARSHGNYSASSSNGGYFGTADSHPWFSDSTDVHTGRYVSEPQDLEQGTTIYQETSSCITNVSSPSPSTFPHDANQSGVPWAVSTLTHQTPGVPAPYVSQQESNGEEHGQASVYACTSTPPGPGGAFDLQAMMPPVDYPWVSMIS